MTGNKTNETGQDVMQFIGTLTDEAKKHDALDLMNLLSDVTGYQPKMWGASIVGYGKMIYKHESGRSGEWPIIGFSPRKDKFSLYFCDGLATYSEQLKRLGAHKTGKGCLYIKRLDQVNLGVLREMVSICVAAINPYQI